MGEKNEYIHKRFYKKKKKIRIEAIFLFLSMREKGDLKYFTHKKIFYFNTFKRVTASWSHNYSLVNLTKSIIHMTSKNK